jgi:hypothetical protein
MEHNAQNQNFKLPQIENIEIKLIPYEAPKLRYFKSSFSKYSQAIEFLITLMLQFLSGRYRQFFILEKCL